MVIVVVGVLATTCLLFANKCPLGNDNLKPPESRTWPQFGLHAGQRLPELFAALGGRSVATGGHFVRQPVA